MTDKLYGVEDTGTVISNDEGEKIELDIDLMSFGNYMMNEDGLFIGEDGEDKDHIAGPFEILGRARDPNGDDWARWIRFKDSDGRQHQVAVRDADLHGDPRTLAATLARQGLWISPKTSHRQQLVGYFNNLECDVRVTFVARTGWHNVRDHRVFVLPNEAYGSPEPVLLNSDVTSPYGYRGTLKDWQNSVGRLTSGQRLGVLATSTAFAGPLLHLCGQDGGGIHYRGLSSSGKTTFARAAASVWGPPDYMRTWRATANGLEGAAVIRSDTLMALDELGVIDSRELNAAVYQLAIGHGKSRARRDGSMRTPASWRVMVVSTGEVSIAAKVEEDRNRRAKAGQEVRIIDIFADVGMGYGAFDRPRAGEDNAAGLADEIVKSAGEFYGTAGPEFLQAIISNGIDKTIDLINPAIEAFCTQVVKLGSDGQIRRAARRLALIAVAGELAREFGIVPWVKGEAIKAAEFALEQWVGGRGGNEAAEVIQSIRAVRLFIERYGDSRFENADPIPEGKIVPIIPNRAGWRRGKGGDQVWLVLPEVWRSEVCAGLDPTHVAKVLAAGGMLERATDGYLKQHWIGGRNIRAYTITAHIFVSEEALDTLDTLEADKTGTSEGVEDPLTAQNTANTKGLTPLTPLTPQTHTDGECKAEEAEVCAQCKAPNDLMSYPTVAGKTVLLHEVCVQHWQEEFYRKLGEFLKRGDQS